ncbi:hypothetical protein KY290_016437 [Solanum tuberosum]|uniref:Uncharacterized protein n=1 Tax=Solanum tuberosum TaxID=4113 RepID=A0ABQ7V8I3_SOLTU|nr:hypothetical protein KY290_016437 [Solanum tuberosum]
MIHESVVVVLLCLFLPEGPMLLRLFKNVEVFTRHNEEEWRCLDVHSQNRSTSLGQVKEDRKPFFHRPPVRLQYGRMLADDAITAALKDHEAKKTKFSDHSKNAVDA